MNGTPIESLKYMQPSSRPSGMDVQTSDLIDEIDRRGDNKNIGDIAQEVSDSLDNLPERRERKQYVKPVQVIAEKPNDKFMHKISPILREPIIIVAIYIILSIEPVRKTLSTYIPQVKQTSDGNVLFVGIVVYALIFAFMYVVAKKLLL